MIHRLSAHNLCFVLSHTPIKILEIEDIMIHRFSSKIELNTSDDLACAIVIEM